jgi:hypothetical protein
MFTDEVEQHSRAITAVLSNRRHVLVRKANRRWADMQGANDRVAQRVMGRDDVSVTSVASGLDGDQFAIFVEVYPYPEPAAQRVCGLSAPVEVIIERGEGRPVAG